MRHGLSAFIFALAIASFCTQARAAEDLYGVVERGYTVFARVGYLSFEGCEFDRAYVVGEYVFVCEGYDYSYEYGGALILTYRGEAAGRAYLCFDDGECHPGHLVPRR